MASRVGLDKNAVLSEAVSLLDETGWDGLTLALLASRLGIRTQSLYAHVDGLDGLRRQLPGDPHGSFNRMVAAFADELEMSKGEHATQRRKPASATADA